MGTVRKRFALSWSRHTEAMKERELTFYLGAETRKTL